MNVCLANSVDLTIDLVGGGWKLAGLFDFQVVKFINLLLRDFFPSHDGFPCDPTQPTSIPRYPRNSPERK